MSEPDVIRATLLAVKTAVLAGRTVNEALLLEIEREMRFQFGGGVSYLGKNLPSDVRRDEIRADIDAGGTAREVARLHGCSIRTVRRALVDAE